MQSETNHSISSNIYINKQPSQARQRAEAILFKRARKTLQEADAQKAVSFVMQNLEVLYGKYPEKDAFLSHLVLFTDEVCERISKENEERLASVLKTLEKKDQIDAENKELVDAVLKVLEQRKPALQGPSSKAQELGSKAQEPDTIAPVQKTNEKSSKTSKSKNKWAVILSILGLIICVVIMLWMVMGLLMALNVCPEYDLGYQWFNNNVLEIF